MNGVKTVSQYASELADREAIRQCIYRYCRGIDRGDFNLVRSAYWPDATDDHVQFVGVVDEFIAWARSMLEAMEQTQHFLGNILIDIVGATAFVESYIRSYHRVRTAGEAPFDLITSGRYIDRMERRDDEWRIAHRVVVRDWFRRYTDSADWDAGVFGTPFNAGRRDRSDPSYALLTPEGRNIPDA